MNTVLITGITGQDGRHLAESLLLRQSDVRIVGTSRDPAGAKKLFSERHQGIVSRIDFRGTGAGHQELRALLAEINPDEIYNFAAPSFVGDSWSDPLATLNGIVAPVLAMLDYLRGRPKARFFQASSAEIFGLPWQMPQAESCPVQPRNPYGAAKAYAHQLVGMYRQQYGVFAVSGILYNHEGRYRGDRFVTMKVCRGIANYLRTSQPLTIGNLEARRDWGCAREFVEAMQASLRCDKARDYVIASGRTHSVREFVECALRAAEIPFEWQGRALTEVARDTRNGQTIVAIDPSFYRAGDDSRLQGNIELLQLATGWKPARSLEEIVREMMDECLRVS
jgi:GDPmannose 4,6-dehydratase